MFRAIWFIIFFLAIAGGTAVAEQPWYELPKLPPPSQYGNLLITRSSGTTENPSVIFSHWRHRILYTCRVCHFELGFEMKLNATEITEEANKNGEFCGTCHDGKVAFGHTEENCSKCHNGNIAYGEKEFKYLYRRFPKDKFGNLDWSRALKRRLIKPKKSIFDDNYSPMPFDKLLRLQADWSMVPPAIFPHEEHTQWLDCANCHPHVFNIKKKTTKHFSMNFILEKKFCGACHLNTAFPLDDCQRCHPGIK